ncbi:hypothetical protein [Shewanella woodyi]|uniref:hypothetical protein n=1 Tax=Shewanella woodyi TaxID=60961 RepID=UPI0007F97303|nr:hypothetical protein [Shewanella woodyi]
MNISRANLKVFKPEQLGSSDDAGGQRTKNEVESGKLNELFRAISDIDHAQSAVDIVKCYPGLDTNNTAILLDGHVFVSQPPEDELVSMLIAESDTLSDADRMTDMVEILESSVVAGQLIRKNLIGLLAGQDSFPRSYLQTTYMFNGKEYYENITLRQGQTLVISVEYEGNEDSQWPRFEHFCEIQKTVTGGRGGVVSFKPPIPFDTPNYDVMINGQSGATKLRYVSENDGIKYHGVTKLSEEASSEVLSVESTQTELLPKLKTIEVSAGNRITSDGSGDVASSLIRKEINVPAVPSQSTYVYTVPDLIDDPYFENYGILPIIATGSLNWQAQLSITGSSVSVVYSRALYAGLTLGVAWYSSLRYAVYNSASTLNAAKKLCIGSVFAKATFTDTNYGVVELTEFTGGELREPNGYVLAIVDYLTGAVTKNDDTRGEFTLVYDALIEDAALSDNSVTFTLAQVDPVLDSFYVSVSSVDGVLLSASSDNAGVITGTGMSGTINQGVVSLTFTQIVDLSSLRYDISETVTLSPPPELYGLNPLRIKNGGVVESFTPWNSLSVQHTQVQAVASPEAAQTYNVRANARFVDITDANSRSLWTLTNDHFTLDKAAGTVTINSDFSGFEAPFMLTDTIGEIALVTDVQPSKLILAAPLSQAYPVGSYVSSVQNLGDLQGRVGVVRDMTAWSNNWDLDGTPAVGSLNVVDYPIEVVNNTAINEDWVLIFTSPTSFRCVGRRMGQIASGDTLSDFSPINPLTNAPYFVIRAEAFGGGWNTGEAVRWPTYASAKPLMLLRTVQSGHSQITTDRAVLAFRGNES